MSRLRVRVDIIGTSAVRTPLTDTTNATFILPFSEYVTESSPLAGMRTNRCGVVLAEKHLFRLLVLTVGLLHAEYDRSGAQGFGGVGYVTRRIGRVNVVVARACGFGCEACLDVEGRRLGWTSVGFFDGGQYHFWGLSRWSGTGKL